MMHYENMLDDCTANQLGFYPVISQAMVKKKRLYKLFTHKGNDKTGSNNSETRVAQTQYEEITCFLKQFLKVYFTSCKCLFPRCEILPAVQKLKLHLHSLHASRSDLSGYFTHSKILPLP